ncbi:MAG: diacylglycerol/lipid kinase family protein [Candidatus Dormibacteria bacterium]
MRTGVVLVNPSRVGSVSALRETFSRVLLQEGWTEPVWIETEPENDKREVVREAIGQGAEVLFACGGDGTVVTALAPLAGSDVALAVVPLGTGNVLARNLGLPLDLPRAIRTGTGTGRRRIDLGEVEGRLFSVAAGIGLDAQMLADAPRRAKSRLGWWVYVAATIRRLGEPRFAVQIRVDSGPWHIRQVRSVLVANVGRLPGGINLVPNASPDDGLLDVAILSPRNLGDWAWLLASMVGSRPSRTRIETFRGRRVEIMTTVPQAREVDGESLSVGTELSVTVRPSSLTVCVPCHF